MSTAADFLHVYWDTEQRYRWSFVSSNGNVIADSGQGYRHKRDALHGFAILHREPVGRVPDYELIRCERHQRTCQVWELARRPVGKIHDDAMETGGRRALFEASRFAAAGNPDEWANSARWLEGLSKGWRR